MINNETIQFQLLLNLLAQLSEGGYKPVSELEDGDTIEECIYYDDSQFISNPFAKNRLYKVINTSSMDVYSQENFSYFEDLIATRSQYWVYAVLPDNETQEPSVSVVCDGVTYTIQNGTILFG